eukprot:TRINITY_DN3359_c0_g2_i2.p1 TRINITY_DN3359_c0_g2~~TRINITY_DN3359_c0_g2_i2.p1  ORF type:complete len:118 (-),score=24.65 TRINITY_DN3359_c0_g2_i2:169-522(-)
MKRTIRSASLFLKNRTDSRQGISTASDILTPQSQSFQIAKFSTHIQAEVSRWDPSISVDAASTPPSSWFTDPEFYQLERQAVFGGSWVAVGRTDQLKGNGAFFSGTLAGEPYVVVRE